MNKITCTYSGFMITKEFGLQPFYGWTASPEDAQTIAQQLAANMEALGLNGNVQMAVKTQEQRQNHVPADV